MSNRRWESTSGKKIAIAELIRIRDPAVLARLFCQVIGKTCLAKRGPKQVEELVAAGARTDRWQARAIGLLLSTTYLLKNFSSKMNA